METPKTASNQALVVCPACGGELQRRNQRHERYRCTECGETYDLEGLSDMEIDLPTFDRLLLYYMKKRKRDWR